MPYGPKRLTDEQVVEIRILYSTEEYTQKQLAEMFKVSQSLVCKIVNNLAHRQAPGLKVSGEAVVRLGYKYAN